MPFLNLSTFEDANGPIYIAEREGVATRMHVSSRLLNSKYAEEVKAHMATTSFIVAHAAKEIENYSAPGWKQIAPEQLRPLGRNFLPLQRKAIEQKKALSKREQELLTPPAQSNSSRYPEIRAALPKGRPGDILKMAYENIEVARAILDFPLLGGLSNDLLERLKPLVMESNLVEIIAGQHSKKPNATELLAFGPDDDYPWSALQGFGLVLSPAC